MITQPLHLCLKFQKLLESCEKHDSYQMLIKEVNLKCGKMSQDIFLRDSGAFDFTCVSTKENLCKKHATLREYCFSFKYTYYVMGVTNYKVPQNFHYSTWTTHKCCPQTISNTIPNTRYQIHQHIPNTPPLISNKPHQQQTTPFQTNPYFDSVVVLPDVVLVAVLRL